MAKKFLLSWNRHKQVWMLWGFQCTSQKHAQWNKENLNENKESGKSRILSIKIPFFPSYSVIFFLLRFDTGGMNAYIKCNKYFKLQKRNFLNLQICFQFSQILSSFHVRRAGIKSIENRKPFSDILLWLCFEREWDLYAAVLKSKICNIMTACECKTIYRIHFFLFCHNGMNMYGMGNTDLTWRWILFNFSFVMSEKRCCRKWKQVKIQNVYPKM